MRCVALLVVLASGATAAAVSGCGATASADPADYTGEAKAVATAVDDLQEAISSRDEEELCGRLLAPALVDAIRAKSKQSCEDGLEDGLKDVDDAAIDVPENAIAVSGSSAAVTVESGKDDRRDRLTMTKVGGRWKLSALGS